MYHPEPRQYTTSAVLCCITAVSVPLYWGKAEVKGVVGWVLYYAVLCCIFAVFLLYLLYLLYPLHLLYCSCIAINWYGGHAQLYGNHSNGISPAHNTMHLVDRCASTHAYTATHRC